jgi:hypothetical protein
MGGEEHVARMGKKVTDIKSLWGKSEERKEGTHLQGLGVDVMAMLIWN